ncbi:MAG: LLM class F420-dependent oxidoreductase [Chloroflexota bacterium]
MRPFFGYHIPSFSFPGVPPDQLFSRVVAQAQAAEAAGFELITVMDHFYQIRGIGPETEPMLEAYSALAALAMVTSRVRLGTLVTGVTYRNPAILAKTVTTLDVISGGRAILGIGAAWNEDEHRGYGVPFPPIKERMDRLDEALAICRAMFTQERATVGGVHHAVENALNEPRPIQPGGIPVLVGGGGEQRTLRIAAKHADMTHWFPLGLDVLRHKTEVLAGYCEEIGRDPDTITRTLASPVLLVASEADAAALLDRLPPERRAMVKAAPPTQAADLLRPYLDAGFRGFTFNNPQLATPDQIGLAGELLALIA